MSTTDESTAVHGDSTPLDIYDDAFLACPFPKLAELRKDEPVGELTQDGWFIISRDEDVRRVLRDTKTFSSSMNRHAPIPPEAAEAVAAIRAKGWPYTNALGVNDAPVHTRYRKLVSKVFTPRSLSWMAPLLETTAEELAAGLPDGGPIDFLEEFAGRIPIWAISRILGLPDAKRDDVRRWTIASTASIGAQPSPADWVRYEEDLLDYQLTIAAELEIGKTDPGEGLIHQLAQAAVNEEVGADEAPLGTGVLLTLIREMVVAGNETTGKAITEGVRMFGADPAVWERLRQDPSYAEVLVEESLRLSSPAQSALRRVTEDTELSGCPVTAGSVVVVSLVSANRDDERFAEAEEFDAERDNVRQHIAFGLGPHACIGATLARMEAIAALQSLSRHVISIEPASDEPLKYTRSFMLRGPLAYPVMINRRPAADIAADIAAAKQAAPDLVAEATAAQPE